MHPIDSGGEPPDERRMEQRVGKLEADVAAMRVDIATILSTCATRAEMNTLHLATKTDISELRQATKAAIDELRSDMHKMNAEIKTWTLATILAIVGTALATLLAMSTIFKNTAPTIQAAAPAPIIITLPGAAAPPAAPASK